MKHTRLNRAKKAKRDLAAKHMTDKQADAILAKVKSGKITTDKPLIAAIQALIDSGKLYTEGEDVRELASLMSADGVVTGFDNDLAAGEPDSERECDEDSAGDLDLLSELGVDA